MRYLGEQIETKSQSLSTSAKGVVKDERFVDAIAKGLAKRVKDKKYCAERQNSPERLSVYKVLAFVPNDAVVEEAGAAAASVGAKLTEKDVAAIKASVSK